MIINIKSKQRSDDSAAEGGAKALPAMSTDSYINPKKATPIGSLAHTRSHCHTQTLKSC